MVNPIAFVLAYTVAGALRPGYSPIHQAISALCVGRYGRLMDSIAVTHTLLLILFAAGFAMIMKPVLSTKYTVLAFALQPLIGRKPAIASLVRSAPGWPRPWLPLSPALP